MKIVDERKKLGKWFPEWDLVKCPRILIFPYIAPSEEATEFDNPIIVYKRRSPSVVFEVQITEVDFLAGDEEMDQLIQALQQAKRFFSDELFANPEKPLPIMTFVKLDSSQVWGTVQQDVTVKPKTLRMNDEGQDNAE